MAEIHVQRKRRNTGWLWVLILLLLIAAVAYYLYTNHYFDKANSAALKPVYANGWIV